MNILVTGNAGLIGSNFCDWLIKNKPDVNVIGIDDLSGGYIENVSDKVIFYKRNIVTDNLDDIFEKHNIDYIYHYAAYAAEGLSPFIREFNYKNNLIATTKLINVAIKYNIKRFLYTSSMSVYGINIPPFNEDMQQSPIDPYGIAKYACEMDLKVANEQHGLDYCIIRPHNCYSNDTEVLTDEGWKLFKDLNNNKVCTLNPDTKNIEYNKPTKYFKFYKNEDLIHYHSNSLLVTNDHPILLITNNNTKINKITTSKLLGNQNKYYHYKTMRNIGNWIGNQQKNIIIPEVFDKLNKSMKNNHQNENTKTPDMKTWVEFLGWFISEGCIFKTPSNYVINICQYKSKNLDNYNKIVKCIKKLGYHPYCTDKYININSKQLYVFLKNIFKKSGAHNKFIPRDILNLNKEYLEILYNSLMLGDGNKDFSRYSTVSKLLADNFQELLFKLNKSSRMYKETDKQNRVIYRITIHKRKQNSPLGNMRTKKIKYNKEQYDGYVYDITVDNHIILVRRNGIVSWGSNCYGERQNIWDKYRNVLGIWMYQHLNDQNLTIFGDGLQQRAFSYIEDAMIPLWNAGIKEEASKQIINLGGIYETTIKNAAETLIDVMGGGEITYLEPRHEVKYAYSTYQKSIDLLEFEHNILLREGLTKMWEWVQKQPTRDRFKWENYELDKGLYSFWR